MAMNKQRRTANLNNIVTYDTLKNVTLLADLTIEGLTGAGFVKADANGLLSVDTGAYLPMPSQTGNAGKFLSTDGSVLSWQSVPQDVNIYNNDGTLTGNRTITSGGFTLTLNPKTFFDNGGTFNASAGNIGTLINTHNYATNSTQLYFYPDSGTNVAQTLNIIPRGSGFNSVFKSQFSVYNNDVIANGMTNAEFVTFRAAGSLFTFASGKFGTGVIRPLMFSAGYATDSATNINQLYLSTSGNVIVGGSTDAGYKLDVQGTGRFTGTITHTTGGDNTGISLFGGTWSVSQSGGSRFINVANGGINYTGGYNFLITGTAATAALFSGDGLTTYLGNGAGYALQLIYNTVDTYTIKRGINAGHIPMYFDITSSDYTASAYGAIPSGHIRIYSGDNTGTGGGGFGNVILQHNGSVKRGNVLIGTSTDAGYRLDVQGTGRFTGDVLVSNYLLATKTSTYSSGASIQSIAAISDVTFASGASISSGTFIGSLISNGINTFNGSITIPNSVIMSSQTLIQRLKFNSAGMTATLTQGGVGIRAAAAQIQQIQFPDDSTTGTISHVAGLQLLAPYKNTGNQVTITNYYGLVLNPSNEYSTQIAVTNRWGIYQVGASDNNYFAGKVIIGSTNTVGSSVLNVKGLPTSSSGLSSGDIWSNSGVLTVVP